MCGVVWCCVVVSRSLLDAENPMPHRTRQHPSNLNHHTHAVYPLLAHTHAQFKSINTDPPYPCEAPHPLHSLSHTHTHSFKSITAREEELREKPHAGSTKGKGKGKSDGFDDDSDGEVAERVAPAQEAWNGKRKRKDELEQKQIDLFLGVKRGMCLWACVPVCLCACACVPVCVCVCACACACACVRAVSLPFLSVTVQMNVGLRVARSWACIQFVLLHS
jgi:hypothetical protein